MQFGVCGDPALAALARKYSYDFVEWSVGAWIKPLEPQVAFETVLAEGGATGVTYPVLNCFVPGDLKITGPAADLDKLRNYVTVVFERAARARVEVIVFGSGAARRIPDGFSTNRAYDQLVAFGSMVAPLAQRQGVTVVVEPLNRSECNVLNTVAECAALVREVAHPNLRLLVDAYHLLRDGDSCQDVEAQAGLLAHVHLATEANRLAPGAEPCDFTPFFQALIRGGYDGRVSIEASAIKNPEKDLPVALAVMRRLEGSKADGG
jgi:sugar phosphate isomerase/epimerase